MADVIPIRTCAFCGALAQGNYSIHRDGFGEGPEVDLCNAHGEAPTPTCEEIWEKLDESRRGGK